MSASSQRRYNTRSRAVRSSPSATPVFSTFPDQAARERDAAASPAQPLRTKATPARRTVLTASSSPRRTTAVTSNARAPRPPTSTRLASTAGGSRSTGGTPASYKLSLGGPGSTAKVAVSTPSAPLSDPCTAATQGLDSFKAQVTSSELSNVQDPVINGQGVDNDTVWRALATVTEAISGLDKGVEFSLLAQSNIESSQFDMASIPCARPGNEALIPWIAGTSSGGLFLSHTSLYVVGRSVENTFTLRHYDSAKGDFHRTARPATGNTIRDVMTRAAWSRGTPTTITSATPSSVNISRQLRNWECGIFVVLYGWSYALDLQLANTALVDGPKYLSFLRQAREIINLALQGLMSSEVIKNFLECFGFIQANQTVPEARRFPNTVRLERHEDYLNLIERSNSNEARDASLTAKSILDEGLNEIRAREPYRFVPNVEFIVAQHHDTDTPLPDLATITAEEFLVRSEFLTAAYG